MRSLLIASLLGLLLTFAASPPASAATTCRPVPFTPYSDDVAAGIRATAVSCAYARDFIRDSEGRPPRTFRRFSCTKRRVENVEGLPYTRYRCVRGERLITWRRY